MSLGKHTAVFIFSFSFSLASLADMQAKLACLSEYRCVCVPFICTSLAETSLNKDEYRAECWRQESSISVWCFMSLFSFFCLCVTWWRVLRVIVRRSLRLQSWQPTSRLAKSERLNNVNRLGWSGTKHIILKGEQQWNLGHTEEKAIIKQTQVYNNHDWCIGVLWQVCSTF